MPAANSAAAILVNPFFIAYSVLLLLLVGTGYVFSLQFAVRHGSSP